MLDEPALMAALKEGRLGGAALDVVNGEPLGGQPCGTRPT
ncbi:MAG: NAD(P)-dependent oxidoreductase [Dehalococcoidia bacterium]